MKDKVNIKNTNSEPKEHKVPKKPKAQKNKKILSDTIYGGFFEKKETLRMTPYFLLFIILGILYITNSYWSEKNKREIQKTKKELIQLRYEYISSKSQLMDSTRQSYIARKLEHSGIKESTVPPTIIISEEE